MNFASGDQHPRWPICSWRDALLVALVCAVSVMLAFGVKVNNHVERREHNACKNRRAIAIQGNRSASDRRNLKWALGAFLNETRLVRHDRRGTSYDLRFARFIDRRIEPRLRMVRPLTVRLPRDC